MLEATSSLLSCKVEGKVFSFLGSNPRKISTWNPLLEKLKRRLMSWKNRFLNCSKIITILKSILCSLSIFTMSFFRIPTKIVKEVSKLQSRFFVGWFGGEKKDSLGGVE